jgi:lipopolysaccharide export system protein LptA
MKYMLVIFLLTITTPALAQTNTEKNKPLEITAEQTLEWHRNDKKYIARGKAEAKQGLTAINAGTLTADYRESQKSNFDIYRMTAEKGVVITSQGNKAFGDKAIYELDSGIATMTGQELKMIAPDQTLTARDKFEYAVTEGRLSAYGDVVIIRGEDKIQADKASAFFAQGTQTSGTTSPMGGRKLKRFEGEGHVIVTTPTEILSGDKGVYNAATNIAEVTGNVKITRGPNVLEGTRAEINLTTNVSRMFGDTTTTSPTSGGKGGRVKGVFYPSSTKTETAPVPVPAPSPEQGYTIIPENSPAAIPPPLDTPAPLSPPIPKPAAGRLTAPCSALAYYLVSQGKPRLF